jgi:hypothetical protein
MKRVLWLLSMPGLLLSGCAIHTPYEVVRYWADWNTERHVNCQCEVFDHLPPKTARVKLMRWGYNVGPPGDVAGRTFPLGQGGSPRWITTDRPPSSTGSEFAPPAMPPTSAPPPAPPAEFEVVPSPAPGPLSSHGGASIQRAGWLFTSSSDAK